MGFHGDWKLSLHVLVAEHLSARGFIHSPCCLHLSLSGSVALPSALCPYNTGYKILSFWCLLGTGRGLECYIHHFSRCPRGHGSGDLVKNPELC